MLRPEITGFEFIFGVINYDIICLLQGVIHILAEDDLSGLLNDIDIVRSYLIIRCGILRRLNRLCESGQIDRISGSILRFQTESCIALAVLLVDSLIGEVQAVHLLLVNLSIILRSTDVVIDLRIVYAV